MSNISNEAKNYLNAKVLYEVLGTNLKSHIIAKATGIEGIQAGIVNELVSHKCLKKINSKWIFTIRLENSSSTFDKVIGDILEAYGAPLEYDKILKEICLIFKCDPNTKEKLSKHLENTRKYFKINDKYGMSEWLLSICNSEENTIFQNYINSDSLKIFSTLFKNANFEQQNYASVISQIMSNSKITSIPLTIIFYIIWLTEKSYFNAITVLEDIDKSNEISILNKSVYRNDIIKDYEEELCNYQKELGDSEIEPLSESDIILSNESISEIIKNIIKNSYVSIDEVINKLYSQSEISENYELIKKYLLKVIVDNRIATNDKQWFVKVGFDESDIETILDYIYEKDSVTAESIITNILNISKEHGRFSELIKELHTLLENREDVIFLGNNTLSKPIEIPEYAKSIPASLIYAQIYPTEDMEGEIFDQEIETDGFEGNLKTEIYNILAEDYNDEDISKTIYNINNTKQKCVLKYHHKIAGTFPLCQISPDFFGSANVFPITVSGQTLYVNNETRLIYGFQDLYSNIHDVSGAIFYIEKTDVPNEYNFIFNGETEKQCAIDLNRSLELLELKGELEDETLTIFDIICQILARKPISFIQLHTEVNIVRRCSRLLVASILSSYHCFNMKGKTGLWSFDEKKIDQGFNKTKKKYIKKIN